MQIANKDLKRQIVDISFKHKLSHLSSCLTAVDLVQGIYASKNPEDIFILSEGHVGLAQYVVLEKHQKVSAEGLLEKHGIHPCRDEESGIYASTGSLGHGIGIALGMAMADRSRNVYCLVSDGELAEGSCWEAFRIAKEQKVSNLIVAINCNGYGAYREVDKDQLYSQIAPFIGEAPVFGIYETNVDYLPFLSGLKGHYHVMSDEDYKFAQMVLDGE